MVLAISGVKVVLKAAGRDSSVGRAGTDAVVGYVSGIGAEVTIIISDEVSTTGVELGAAPELDPELSDVAGDE